MFKKCFSYNYSDSKIQQIFFIYKFLLLKAQNKIDFLILAESTSECNITKYF